MLARAPQLPAQVSYVRRRRGSRLTLSRMLEVLATLQMREMMDTLWVQDTLAKSPKADISDWISSSIKSRSQILLCSIRQVQLSRQQLGRADVL